MDKLTPEQRHKNMVANKSRNTTIEIILGCALRNMGLRYRKNDKRVFGHPDFSFYKEKVAVFCDGEFWHGKEWETNRLRIKSNESFWYAKIERNIEHDKKVNETLSADGWTVIRLWESDIRKSPDACVEKIAHALKYNDSVSTNYAADAPASYYSAPFCLTEKYKFTFADINSGIGSVRLALQDIGGKCIYSSEWDSAAQQAYALNFGEIPNNYLISKDDIDQIPYDFDILCVSLTNQSFLFHNKRNHIEQIKGTQFQKIADIINMRHPKALLLICNTALNKHGEEYLEFILKFIEKDLCYHIPSIKSLNATDFGLPHNHECSFITAFSRDTGIQMFNFQNSKKDPASFFSIKEKNGVDARYFLTTKRLASLINKSKKSEFGFEIIPDKGVAVNLFNNRQNIKHYLVTDDNTDNIQVNQEGLRYVTPRECARLLGFPDEFRIPENDNDAYRLISQSISIPMTEAIGKEVLRLIDSIS